MNGGQPDGYQGRDNGPFLRQQQQHPYARFGGSAMMQSPQQSRQQSHYLDASNLPPVGSHPYDSASYLPQSSANNTGTYASIYLQNSPTRNRAYDSLERRNSPSRGPLPFTSQGPSFASSSSASLPGALGISQPPPTPDSRPQGSLSRNVVPSSGYSPFGGFQTTSASGPISSPTSSFPGHTRALGGADSSPSASRSDMPPTSASASNSSLSSLSATSKGYGYGIGGPSAGSGSGALGLSSTNTSRDFLVPIGATGARQKLSILSPNQRRMGSVSSDSGPYPRGRRVDYDASPVSSLYRPSATATPTSAHTPASPSSFETTTPKSATFQSTPRPTLAEQDHNLGASATHDSPQNYHPPQRLGGEASNPLLADQPATSTPPRPVRSNSRNLSTSSSAPLSTSGSNTSLSENDGMSRSSSQGSTSFTSPLRTSKQHRQIPSDPPSRVLPPTPQGVSSLKTKSSSHTPRSREQSASSDSLTRGLLGSGSQGDPHSASLPSSDALPDLSRVPTPTQASAIASQWRQDSERGTQIAPPTQRDTVKPPPATDRNAFASRDSASERELHIKSRRSADIPAQGQTHRETPDPVIGDASISASSSAFSSFDSSSSSSDIAGTSNASRREGIKGKINKMLGSSRREGGLDVGKPLVSDPSTTRVATDYGREKNTAEGPLAARYRDAIHRGEVGLTASRSVGDVGLQSRSDTNASETPPQIKRAKKLTTPADSSAIGASVVSSSLQHDKSRRGGPATQQPPRRHDTKGTESSSSQQLHSTADDSALSSYSLDSAATPPTSSSNITTSDSASHSRESPDLQLKLGDWGDDLQSLLPSVLTGSSLGDSVATALPDQSPPTPSARTAQSTVSRQGQADYASVLPGRALPPTPTSAATVTVDAARPETKPRSPPRPLPPQPDLYTLSRLNGSTPSQPQPMVIPSSDMADERHKSPSTQQTGSSNDVGILSSGGAVAQEAKTRAPKGVDPKTYVPKDALTRNRKGTAVATKPSSANTDGISASIGHLQDDQFGMSDDEEDFVVPLDSGSTLPSSAWTEVETALATFRGQGDVPVDKGVVIRNVLLPFLALEAETPNLEVMDGKFRSSKARRALFFDWIAHLLVELQHVQTSADRGAILESIACIIESRNLAVTALANDSKDEARFSSTFGHILLYAIGELNKKGVYQNTLIFSGRLLAIAFFRVEGVASKLLRALPINRFAMERVAAEAQWEKRAPKNYKAFVARFPPSLRDFCFQDARSYLRALDAQSTAGDESDADRYLVRQPEVEVEMTGNWLRRWQSDDSELFFSFCRSYHRQLAGLLMSTRALQGVSKRFFGGPGYAHLATCIHLKCLSLVNRVILSVTTLSSQKNFNPGETANVLSGSTAGKPRHLEAANRRCTAIIVDIVRAPSGNNQTFLPMLGTHIKCLVKRTSLYDVQSVFCLLDWLDGVLGHMDAVELPIESLVDIDFVIEMIGLLLANADHALALMRTIAFCYSNFAVLIGSVTHRKRFCESILLDRKVFHKLFLSWSFTIRAYFLHLLVFRLARLKDFSNPEGDAEGKTSVEIAKLFSDRLDEIRKRHEELSPPVPDATKEEGAQGDNTGDGKSQDGDASSTYSRIKSSRTSFVSTIRHTPSVHQPEQPTAMTKAERVLGIGMPDPLLMANKSSEPKSQSRAAKWLRALGGKGASKNKQGGTSSASTSNNTSVDSASFSPPSLDSPNISNRPRFNRKPVASDLDFDTDDEDEGGEEGGDASEAEDSLSYEGNRSGKGRGAGPSSRARGMKKESEYEFDFEQRRTADSDEGLGLGGSAHHNDNITPDASFDLQSPQSPTVGTMSTPFGSGAAGNRASSTASPQLSRSISKRGSMLPGPAAELAEGDGEGKAAKQAPKPSLKMKDGYAESLHIYATQGLREWEAVLAEHDEFFATIADQSGPPAVPRLPVQWPAMWSD